MTLAGWLNTAWMLKCAPEAWAFARAARRVQEAQTRLLLHTLHANRDTEFGRAHCFATIKNARMYQERVPLASFADFADPVARIARGEANVLTREPVRLLEPTSGTTNGEKLIPYTAGLRRQFQRGVEAWIADLFRRRPAVRSGRAYWSISPPAGPPRRSAGGLPIGFDEETAYLGRAEQFALRRLLVAPGSCARMTPMENFRYGTLLGLLAAGDLALISVWSPTFLTALLAPLEEWQERLCFDLGRGTFSPPLPMDREAPRCHRGWLDADPARADLVSRVLQSSASLEERLQEVWPRLALISCWGDAAAARFLPDLRRLFPKVEIQPKGLLATEGFVSFPLIGCPGAVLSLRSHFFEFAEASSARCQLAHELDLGGRYRVVITTAGGLYRYQLGDEVEVVGFHRECPLIRFVGRSDTTSDLVGEKLAEPHVRAVIDRLLATHRLQARFALLVPVLQRLARYRLYLQGAGITALSPLLGALREGLENGLMENPYYRHAVAAGQLAGAEVTALDPAASPWLLYERRCLDEGQKCGSIKPMALDRRPGWPEIFSALESDAVGRNVAGVDEEKAGSR
jgi:hypothetical protein